MTAHIESKKEDISELVIMPGDPLRAKYIADTYLTDVKQVNSVRNMFAYTGYFNNVKVTIFPSGMGIPSIGIYAYELFKFYDVKKIIRVGTSGSLNEKVKVYDTVLATSATSLSNFPLLFSGDKDKIFFASKELNETIIKTAGHNNLRLKVGDIITSDVFDVYVDFDKWYSNFPKNDYLMCEMESSCLFYLAKLLNREAACLATVVDSKYEDIEISSEERQNKLDDMIKLALLSITNNK